MKKVILFTVAFIAAMGASAQLNKTTVPLKGKVTNELVASASVKMSDTGTKNKIKKIVRAEESETGASIYGDYVVNSESQDGKFTGSRLGVTFESAEAQFEGDETVYNVLISNLFGVEDKVYAYFDEADSTLTIPANQIILESTMGYDDDGNEIDLGNLIFLSLVEKEDGIYYSEDPAVLVLNEDGSFDLDADTYALASYLVDYQYVDKNTGETKTGTGYDFLFATRVLPCNATLDCTTTSSIIPGFPNETNDWIDAQIPMSVEYYETALTINGFANQAPVEVTINDDGSCDLILGTRMTEYDYSARQAGIGPMILNKCFIGDDGYLDVDYTAETLPGAYVDDNTIYFFTVEQREDGKYYYVDHGIVISATKTFNNGQNFYSAGYFYGMALEYDVAGQPTGILNANNTLEYKAKNTKTYNLMGQQVDRKAVKGLMIRDGKKYIAK